MTKYTSRADFWFSRNPAPTFGERIELAKLGIFSIDTTAHRAMRQAQADEKRAIEQAYLNVGMHRDTEHNRIAAEMEATMTSGIWAKSTGEFAGRCAKLDAWVLELNQEEIEI